MLNVLVKPWDSLEAACDRNSTSAAGRSEHRHHSHDTHDQQKRTFLCGRVCECNDALKLQLAKALVIIHAAGVSTEGSNGNSYRATNATLLCGFSG